LKAGLRRVADQFHPEMRLTPSQNILLINVNTKDKEGITRLLAEHGVVVEKQAGPVRLASMACPALPTCGLALAESERLMPDVITRIESLLSEAGLPGQEIIVRMTGCPNGCARPYVSEIGLVGRTPGVYNLYLGGAHEGTRLNKLHRRDVDGDTIVAVLTPLFEAYARERTCGERFGDFVIRSGVVKETTAGLNFHENLAADLEN
jgi:sulfite reductase (NADPH) hemoprotein beta-component